LRKERQKQRQIAPLNKKLTCFWFKNSHQNADFSNIETSEKITAIFANFLPTSDNY